VLYRYCFSICFRIRPQECSRKRGRTGMEWKISAPGLRWQ